MRRTHRHPFLGSVLLVVMLVAAQATVLGHLDLDDAHAGGDGCALCAGSATLGSAVVANVAVVLLPAVDGVALAEPSGSFIPARTERRLARGPPATS